MHETAIIQNLLDVLREVRIDVGRLEHLDETVLQAAWTALTEGTNVAGVKPHIDRTPVRLRCQACGGEYEPHDLAGLACPACRVARPEILAGDDVLLVEVSAHTGEGTER
jgi:Zn finger protein HypA/HybF involved in hydrogenase expression